MASQVLEDGAMASGSAQQEHDQQDRNMTKRAMKPNKLRCPRCDSGNTKFCYYNNRSLSQPRHFCKACRRYWTQGGSLRNVPIGGGCRRKTNNNNKRSSSSSSSSKKLSSNLQYQDSSSNNNTFLVPSLNPSNPAAALLDILRGRLPADSSNNAGLNYGFGGGGGGGGLMIMPLPFDGGLMLNSTEAVTTTTAAAAAAASTGQAEQLMVVHQQWPAHVGGWGDHATTANDLAVLVDPMLTRDNYWNGTVGSSSSPSSWHGLTQHLSYVE